MINRDQQAITEMETHQRLQVCFNQRMLADKSRQSRRACRVILIESRQADAPRLTKKALRPEFEFRKEML
jgi:hypothetical protein